MTIRKRLARSNLIMILIPVAIAAVLLLAGGGLAVFLLKRVYLPRLGLSMAALHETGEQLETAFDGVKVITAIYGATVVFALLAAVAFTNLYLTKHLFRHIQRPLDELVEGVRRIQNGDLDAPIGYGTEDEFMADAGSTAHSDTLHSQPEYPPHARAQSRHDAQNHSHRDSA